MICTTDVVMIVLFIASGLVLAPAPPEATASNQKDDARILDVTFLHSCSLSIPPTLADAPFQWLSDPLPAAILDRQGLLREVVWIWRMDGQGTRSSGLVS